MNEKATKEVLAEVSEERSLRHKVYGEQDYDPFRWIAELGDKYGKVCSEAVEALETNPQALQGYREELVQLAAMAVEAVECLDRANWKWSILQELQKDSKTLTH